MNHTHCSQILSQLTSSGYQLVKCPTEKEWHLIDVPVSGTAEIVLRARGLGDLAKKASKEFGL